MKLTVLGAGCWGLTLAWLLTNNFDEITVWGRAQDLSEDLIKNKHCSKPLEVQLDSKIEITSDLSSAIRNADIILSVVATSGTRDVCEHLTDFG
jgi:glycerol-3-phosphate dehydrogenase (NAD(P)+)